MRSDVISLGEIQVMPLRKALLAACLALPVAGLSGAAHANSPQTERVIRLPPGSVVLVLPGAAVRATAETAPTPASSVDFPVLHMIAAQNAIMRRMMARQMQVMDRLTMSMPNPARIVRAALGRLSQPHLAPGDGVVSTTISDGHGVCRETVTYRIAPDGARPLVHVARSGNDCGALAATGPTGVTQTMPAAPRQPRTAPAAAPHESTPNHPPVWTVSYPAHQVRHGTPHA